MNTIGSKVFGFILLLLVISFAAIQPVRVLIQGGIVYAQESYAKEGRGGLLENEHAALRLATKMQTQGRGVSEKKRWLTFDEVRRYFKIDPKNVSELRKQWPYAQIVIRSDGTHLVWVSQGVLLPSSINNTKKSPKPESLKVTSHSVTEKQEVHKDTMLKEETHLVNIAYAAHIDLEAPKAPEKEWKRENCLQEMVTHEKNAKGIIHVVVSGESVSGIAQRYDLEWRDLYQINRKIIGDNPNLLYPGQQLHIPSTVYVVKNGDSLSKISMRVGMEWEKIYDLNKEVIGDNPNLIEPGQKLTFSHHTYVAQSGNSSRLRDSSAQKYELKPGSRAITFPTCAAGVFESVGNFRTWAPLERELVLDSH
ncbi:MAG: LysM peptidoglycan-binding domain-containing protein [bacterium]